jgi:hypothetical protein
MHNAVLYSSNSFFFTSMALSLIDMDYELPLGGGFDDSNQVGYRMFDSFSIISLTYDLYEQFSIAEPELLRGNLSKQSGSPSLTPWTTPSVGTSTSKSLGFQIYMSI